MNTVQFIIKLARVQKHRSAVQAMSAQQTPAVHGVPKVLNRSSEGSDQPAEAHGCPKPMKAKALQESYTSLSRACASRLCWPVRRCAYCWLLSEGAAGFPSGVWEGVSL